MELKQIYIGNVLLIVCCFFYLAWWILAFRPNHETTGQVGWLLLPAAIAGISAFIFIIQGSLANPGTEKKEILTGIQILLIGIGTYFFLFVLTNVIFHRIVTTELMLIVGWTMVTIAELNALYRLDMFSAKMVLCWMGISLGVAMISLVCYILYYTLNKFVRYLDGMIPLGLIAIVMFGITLFMLIVKKEGK